MPSPRLAVFLFSAAFVAAIGAMQARSVAEPPGQSPASQPAASAPSADSRNWLLWGGPTHDFKSPARNLASSWPAAGPKRLWSRPLGEGYSPIAIEGNRLYVMYSVAGRIWGAYDIVAALAADTGQTVWENKGDSAFRSSASDLSGGPRAMPQVVGDRLVTADSAGRLSSLDKKTGKVVWSHDLREEYGASRMEFGYSCHALPYKDTLIVMVGGARNSLMAFKQADGRVAWGKHSFPNSHSSPLPINVDGQDQVVALMGQEVVAVDPATGDLLWQHRHPTQYDLAISTPVWGPDNILVVSSSYEGGTRALHLAQSGGKTTVKELWHNPRVRVHFGSMIRIGDTIYASSGHDGPAPITAFDVKSGRVLWHTGRDFAKSQLLLADGKLIVLDQDGVLALATPSPDGLKVHSRVQLLERFAWTPPTLVGTRLYVRDRRTLMALDLAQGTS